jgi:hypothetical protein
LQIQSTILGSLSVDFLMSLSSGHCEIWVNTRLQDWEFFWGWNNFTGAASISILSGQGMGLLTRSCNVDDCSLSSVVTLEWQEARVVVTGHWCMEHLCEWLLSFCNSEGLRLQHKAEVDWPVDSSMSSCRTASHQRLFEWVVVSWLLSFEVCRNSLVLRCFYCRANSTQIGFMQGCKESNI